MRRIFVPFVLLFALMFAGCTYDDSELVERIEELERSNNVSTLREQVESLTKSITALETLSTKFDELSAKNGADILDLGIAFEQLQEYVEERLDRVETHTAWLEDIIDGKIEDALSGGADVDDKVAELRLWVEGTYATLGQYDALSEDMAQLESALSTIQDDLAAYKQEVEESFDIVGDELVEIENNISNMSSDIQDLYDIVNELEESIKTDDYIIEQFQSIEARLAEHSVDISELDNRLNAVEQQSETFASHIEDLYAAIEEIKSELVAEYKRAIETAIMENGGVIDAKIEAEIEEVNARVNAELESIKERIDSLEQRIDDLEDAIDKIKALDLEFDIEDGVACMAGASIEFGYRVIGGDDDTKVESFGDGGWRTRVTPTDATQGRIKVTAPKDDAEDGKIVVLATSGAGGTCMKAIYFDRGIITDIMDSYETSYMANTLAVTLKTNLEYDVEISAEAQSWISCADTRAELREDTLSFTIEENLYDEPRTAVIHLVGALGDKLQSFEIVQQKSPLNAPIQFADQNVKRVCVEKFDTNGDGELSYKEVAKVERIDRKLFGDYAAAVKSFDELQYFINLTTIGGDAFTGCRSLTSVTIPDSVTGIGGYAFHDCRSLTSVTIPNSVTGIGGYAFGSCNSLTSVTIPDSVTTIGEGAFSGCSNLTAFYGKFASEDNRCLIVDGVLNSFAPSGLTAYNIPDSVTTIGDYAFYDCDSLTSVTIPDSVTTIGDSAFYSCTSLPSVTIPDGVTTIGDYAFYDCDSLPSVTIPDSVTTIGYAAFYHCDSLTSVTIPDGVTTIGGYAFYYCKSLASVTIGNSVTTIGDSAFYSCTSLTSVTIPDGVTTIGGYAFYFCTSLTSVTIPDSVTTIGYYAFDGCDSLPSVTIPDSVTSIGLQAFGSCSSLTSVYCKSTTPPTLSYRAFYKNADDRKIYVPAESVEAYKAAAYWSNYADAIVGYNFEDSGEVVTNNEIWYTNGSTTEATTPYSTDVFGANIVSNLYDTEKGCWVITFDGDVTTIGDYTFYHCDSLTSVTIPDSVTTIGSYAFRECDSLTSVTIPDSVTTIGSHAFRACDSLTSVTIPDSVTTLGYEVFTGCSSLKEFKGKFAADGGRCLIMGNTIIAYAEASGTTYTILDSVTMIGENAFNGCSNLTSVTIPDSVTTIGYYAFSDCRSLTSVTIPDSVTTIYNWAFDGCSSLVSATIGDGVKTIGEGVFAYCNNLAEFKGKYATENGRCLVKDNAIVAYANASGTEYTIPDDIEMIEKSAFRGCTDLTAVIIPSGVKAIGINAFLDCGNLTEVYCKSTTPPTLGSGAFNENADDRKIYVPAESVGAYKSAAYWSDYADAIVGYDFGNAGITDWNKVYVRSAFDDCKHLMMEASGFTGEFYLHKLGAKKSDALAAAVYTVGAWEFDTSRDYCEDAVSKTNGVTLKSGEVVVETSGDGYKVTFNVVDKNGTEWKGTYTGDITQP